MLRDAKSLEGFLHVVGYVVPRTSWLLPFGQVVADLVKFDIVEVLICPLGRHWLLVEDFKCLESKVQDPWSFFFDFGDVFDGVFIETYSSVELVVFRILKVSFLGVDVDGFVLDVCIGHNV